MKKSLYIAALCLAVFSSCSKEKAKDIQVEEVHSFCINTTAPSLTIDDAGTRASMKAVIRLQWSTGDQISVVNLSTGKTMLGNLSAVVNGDRVRFEGELSGSIRAGDKMAAIYPCQNYTGIVSVPDFELDLSSQTCTTKEDLQFAAYSLFDCKTTGVVEVTSDFVVPVSFNQITLATIDPETKIDYVELTNVGNGISFHVNKTERSLELTPSVGKVRITPEAKLSGENGALFAYCALASSPAANRAITVKALPKIYYASWAGSAMSAAKFYTSVASAFNAQEYKDFMVSAPASLDVGYQGGTLAFSVTSNNVGWMISSTPVLTIEPSSGSGCENLEVIVTIPQNDESAARSFVVTFSGGKYEYHYSIHQEADPNNEIIEFPDINLKRYMVTLFDDNEDGQINAIEAENVVNVNCGGKNVSDLSGLEKCPNLKYLNFNNNYVSEINLCNNLKLETIVAYGNPIERILLNNATSLKALYLQNVSTNAIDNTTITIDDYNQASTLYLAFAGTKYESLRLRNSSVLTSYDVSENTHLKKLIASGNSFVTAVNVASLTELTDLDLNACGLTSLNVDTNTNLVNLDCSSNKISSLNIDNCVTLVNLDCSDNLLTSLRVTNNKALEKIDVSMNQINNINIRKNTNLKNLNVSSNSSITALALENNTALEILNASNTGLLDVDLSANLLINILNIANTPITTLAIVGNDALSLVNTSCCASLIRTDYSNGRVFSTGSVVVVDNIRGVVFYTSRIVSIDETKTSWGYASSWCTDHGSGWYFADVDTMVQLYNAKTDVNNTLSSLGGTLLGTGGYWSSSHFPASNLSSAGYYYVRFSDGGKIVTYGENGRNTSLSVRAVRNI